MRLVESRNSASKQNHSIIQLLWSYFIIRSFQSTNDNPLALPYIIIPFKNILIYFSTVNGTIWWLILTITWLLAAGFKWGSEAIEKYSLYYHLVAWGIPALQTMAVVTFSKIEGDNIAGKFQDMKFDI